MQKITIAFASLCLAVVCSTPARAYGALVICTSNEELSYGTSKDQPTKDVAQSAAISAYEQIYGRSRCTTPKRIVLFSDSCVALSAKPVENNWPRPQRSNWRENQDFSVGGGGSEQDAQRSASAGCNVGSISCEIETVICDGVETAPSQPVAPPVGRAIQSESIVPSPAPLSIPHSVSAPEQVPATPAPSIAPAPSPAPTIQKSISPPIAAETGIIEFRYLSYLSAGILAVLFMWLLWALSIRTPYVVLAKYLSVAVWAGLPLLIAFLYQVALFEGSLQQTIANVLAPAFVQLYSTTYVLLYTANRLRVWGSPEEAERTNHVFLRLPALTVTIPIALALHFSQHKFKPEVDFAICSLLGLAVFGIGYFIRPYQVTAPSTTTIQLPPEVRSQVEPAVVEAAPAQTPEMQEAGAETTRTELLPTASDTEAVLARRLPAVIPQTSQVLQPMPPIEGIVLRLKRSQKTATMGSLIYMLDARIDASQETLSLISKHNLGGRLIYESEARQKHVAAAQGHLAATRGGPSLLAPASEQAKGAAGTIWKLGRAAVSAVRASLALRITVNSLLSGVHVECKSMEELLEAEAAIREAKENLEGFLETAQTFDGREEIH